MRFFFIFGMILSAIMVMATPIDSVESANSTQTNEDANVENKSTEQTNEDAIVENKSTEQMNEDAIVENKSTEQTNEDAIFENKSLEQTNEDAIVENKSTEQAARKMYIKRRLAKMDKEADENEKKHRLDEGPCTHTRLSSDVLEVHILEPSIYTVHSGSYWFPCHMCPERTFVKKYQQWQDDSDLDQKGLIYVGLCCLPLGAHPSDCDSDSNWIWSGNTNNPDRLGHKNWKAGCQGDHNNPNKWVTGLQAFFKNPSVGAIHMRIGCDNEPNGRSVSFSGDTIPAYNPEIHTGLENVKKFCAQRQAICGFRLNGETSLLDNSGINKIKFFCCELPRGHYGI